jgi:Planctomycete cytochrome C
MSGRALTRAVILFIAALFSAWSPTANGADFTPGQAVDGNYENFARGFLQSHCVDCHGETDPEASLSLHDVGPIDEINAATWRSIWAQVTLKEMPPRDAEQPEVIERLRFSEWIVGELTRVMRDKGGFHDHLDPNKGNFVDHDLLFGVAKQLLSGLGLISMIEICENRKHAGCTSRNMDRREVYSN